MHHSLHVNVEDNLYGIENTSGGEGTVLSLFVLVECHLYLNKSQ